jgi:hypothetical protein
MSRQPIQKRSKQRCEAFGGPLEAPQSARHQPPPISFWRWSNRPIQIPKASETAPSSCSVSLGHSAALSWLPSTSPIWNFAMGGCWCSFVGARLTRRAKAPRLPLRGAQPAALFRPVTRTGKIAARRLSARAVAELVKTYARRAGLKAADFSGHSLRSGFLTSAAARGASIFKMMDVSRRKSVDTLRAYVREMFRDQAGRGLL